MKDITCTLYLPPYLHDYIVNKYGTPAKFSKRSIANHLLIELSERRRSTPLVVRGVPTRVVLPDHRYKKPEHYHHFTRRAHAQLVRCLVRELSISLMDAMHDATLHRVPILSTLHTWCQAHGIRVAHREAIRRMYYRAIADRL